MTRKKIILLLTIANLLCGAFAAADCSKFLINYENAKTIVSLDSDRNQILDSQGATANLNVCFVNSTLTGEQEAEAFNLAALFSVCRDAADLSSFSENSVCYQRLETLMTSPRPKFRSFDGFGNNLEHPSWGAVDTPFGRFGPKTFADGVNLIRKSDRSYQYLPSPREIVEKVLKQAKKTPRTSNISNSMLIQFLVFISDDLGDSLPSGKARKVSCCTAGNKAILPRKIRHSSCAPISIPKDDSFYNAFGVRCMRYVRSQLVSSPSSVKLGEVKNKASSFADLSNIYGSTTDESFKIRSFLQGKIMLSPGQTLPVDAEGKFTNISARLNVAISVISWVVLFCRNHNNIAESLAALNPSWEDEKLYQEARRTNIAVLQNLMLSKDFTDMFFFKKPLESYNSSIDPSCTVEFLQATRFNHFYVPSFMRLLDENGQVTDTPQSDVVGRVDILDKSFEDSLRGALNQSMNFDGYSDELHNKLFKNKDAVGLDVFSFDIQRGRDHGLPTWVEMRRKCGSSSNFLSFGDLARVFPTQTAELLEKTYDSVEDIDLIVGGALETFNTLNQQHLGSTFSCIMRDEYRRFTSGDAYFFSHSNNPNPFTPAQLKAITDFSVNHLICTNSKIEFTNKNWMLVDSLTNPKVSCSSFNQMDLKPWSNV